MSFKSWFAVLGCLGVLMVSFSGAARADAVVGQEAPAFVAKRLDGQAFDLSAHRGKVALVYFWTTWCTDCLDEMAALEAVWRKYHGRGLEVLAVSADPPRTRKDVKQVMTFFSFPAAVMKDVSKNELVTLAGVPMTFLVGKDGKVVEIATPRTRVLTESVLGAQVEALLDAKEEKKSEAPKTDDVELPKEPGKEQEDS